jgi:glycosyltransferase involved in cell wall biosynthesis
VPAGPNRIPMYRDFAILIFTRWLFKKIVFQFRASGISEIYQRLSLFEQILFRIAYFNVDLAIRLSELTPNDGTFIRAHKNVIVPNGLEDHFEKIGMPLKKNNLPSVLLFVGVLHESKGIMVLLEACRHLKDSGLTFKFRLMGKFESLTFRHRVEEFIKIKELSDYIEFLGVQTGNKKWEAYRNADIFVFPSYFHSETMPRVVLEAMSFEIPVVATRWRGVPSVVEDGKSGFLVPIKDSRALAEKIAMLLKDTSLRDFMGKRGREIYLEQFTAEKFWRNMEEAFLSVAESHH